jgi:hypothetical protein
MIAALGGALLEAAASRRRRALERVSRAAGAVQEAALLSHVRTARDTEFGLAHGFASIRSVADYQTRVPLRDYLGFKPSWDAALAGTGDVAWPGRPRIWVKTSGTTAGDKAIPVTPEAVRAHRRGGWDALLMAAERVGGGALLGGPMLMLGGSTALAPAPAGARIGDLSGVMAANLPPGLRRRYSPGLAIARIPDWETRIAAVAALVERQDLRMLAGMPSWILVLLEHVARRREAGLDADLGALWPNLEVFVHGGVSFGPYRGVLEARLGRRLECVEVYPASEAFVAVQTEREGGLTLMLDYGVFYEFVPLEDLGRAEPPRHTVADVELGRPYAVVLTTPAGLWSYVLGDTVRFTARDPLRLVITGRTRHYVNAFGENVIVEEVERALMAACRVTGADVAEFTVAPRFPEPGEARGGHDWLVEFRTPPADGEAFVTTLDRVLRELNSDYRTKRAGGLGLQAPRLLTLPPGAFHRWLGAVGKLGDQHKVPRVTNSRAVADAVPASAAAGSARGHGRPRRPLGSSVEASQHRREDRSEVDDGEQLGHGRSSPDRSRANQITRPLQRVDGDRAPTVSGGRAPPGPPRGGPGGRLTPAWRGRGGGPCRAAPEARGEPRDSIAELAGRLGDAARHTPADLDQVAADVLGRLDGAARGADHRRPQLASDVLDRAQRLDERALGQMQDTEGERLGGAHRGGNDGLRRSFLLDPVVPTCWHGCPPVRIVRTRWWSCPGVSAAPDGGGDGEPARHPPPAIAHPPPCPTASCALRGWRRLRCDPPLRHFPRPRSGRGRERRPRAPGRRRRCPRRRGGPQWRRRRRRRRWP